VLGLVDGGDDVGGDEGEKLAPGLHGEGVGGGDEPATGGLRA
jgi:hypothetical protein